MDYFQISFIFLYIVSGFIGGLLTYFFFSYKKEPKAVKNNIGSGSNLPLPSGRHFLNPMWTIEVTTSSGRPIIKKPFTHFIHTYLKDYGFDPDHTLISPSANVILVLEDTKARCKIPLYLDEKAMNKTNQPKIGGF